MSASYARSGGILVCLWSQNNPFILLECAHEVCNASLSCALHCDQCSPPPPHVRKCALYWAVYWSPLKCLPWSFMNRPYMNILHAFYAP